MSGFRGSDATAGIGTRGRPAPAEVGDRFVEIDVLKAIGILAVVLIHSLRPPWDPRISTLEVTLGIVTRFAVPGFLFCSGFLYATTARIPASTLGRRWRRLLVPYLIASIGAQLWWQAVGQGHPVGAMLRELAFASSFGPYYYVFVHFFLVGFAALLACMPRSAVVALTLLFLGSQAWSESGVALPYPLYWHLRSPLLWWGYFLLGWLVRLERRAIDAWIARRRARLLGLLTLLVLGLTLAASTNPGSAWARGATWLDIHAILALLFVAASGLRASPPVIRTLSDATFAIYLLHLFFVYATQRLLQPAPGVFDAVAVVSYWSAGVLGSLGLIALVRFLLGEKSKDVIGA